MTKTHLCLLSPRFLGGFFYQIFVLNLDSCRAVEQQMCRLLRFEEKETRYR